MRDIMEFTFIAEAFWPVPPTRKRKQLRRKRRNRGTGANGSGGVRSRMKASSGLRRHIPSPYYGCGPGAYFGNSWGICRGFLEILEGLLRLPWGFSVDWGSPGGVLGACSRCGQLTYYGKLARAPPNTLPRRMVFGEGQLHGPFTPKAECSS